MLFDGIPLGEVSTSMTINAPAALLLLLYQLVAEEHGVPGSALNGTIQNDVLKEYIARGTYIYPPAQSLRLITDIFRTARPRSRGGTRSRSPAITWPRPGRRPRRRSRSRSRTASSTSGRRSTSGLDVDEFAPRLAFFFVARTTLLEEVAKFRAARRIWARVMRDEFGAKNPKSLMLRFHTQTAGVQLTAQQPEVNLVRVARAGPRCGARRDPVAAHELLRRGDRAADREGGPAGAADPAGARVRERRDRDRRPVRRVVRGRGDDRRGRGGGAGADGAGRGARRRGRRDRAGLPEERDRASAYRIAREIDGGERVVVGVNRFVLDEEEPYEPLRVDPAIEARAGRAAGDAAPRAGQRRGRAPPRRAASPGRASGTDANVLYPMREALRARATVGEVCDALREVWGRYVPPDSF